MIRICRSAGTNSVRLLKVEQMSECQVKQIVIISSVQPKQTMNQWKFIMSRVSWYGIFSNVSLFLDDGRGLSVPPPRHSTIQDSGQACQNWIVFVWENPLLILWWMNSIVVMFSSSVTVQNVCCLDSPCHHQRFNVLCSKRFLIDLKEMRTLSWMQWSIADTSWKLYKCTLTLCLFLVFHGSYC